MARKEACVEYAAVGPGCRIYRRRSGPVLGWISEVLPLSYSLLVRPFLLCSRKISLSLSTYSTGYEPGQGKKALWIDSVHAERTLRLCKEDLYGGSQKPTPVAVSEVRNAEAVTEILHREAVIEVLHREAVTEVLHAEAHSGSPSRGRHQG